MVLCNLNKMFKAKMSKKLSHIVSAITVVLILISFKASFCQDLKDSLNDINDSLSNIIPSISFEATFNT